MYIVIITKYFFDWSTVPKAEVTPTRGVDSTRLHFY